MLCATQTLADEDKIDTLQSQDIFTLEYASDVDISDDGKQVYFVRNYMDIYTDKKVGNIWQVNTKGELVPVTNGLHADYSPILSPDGEKLAYISTASGKPQVHIKWLESGREAQMTHLTNSPSQLSWSPDGSQLAFSAFVMGRPNIPVNLPGKPPGAKWAEPATVTQEVYYRFDGAGYLPAGTNHLFVMSADGGTPRQITSGNFNHSGHISWTKDGKNLIFSANRHEDHEYIINNTEVFSANINTGELTQLTERFGPDFEPHVSPDGKLIAYRGFDDKFTNYENSQLYVMNIDGSNKRLLTADLDRTIEALKWAKNSRGVYIQYDDLGKGKVAYQPLKGKRKVLIENLGGKAYGRPYGGGDFDVSENGTIAFTHSLPTRPADVAINVKGKTSRLTALNEDALGHKTLGKVEEIWYKSSADNRDIQGWVVYPPDFDASKKYPLILEIHGGPVTNYGPRFSTEIQLMAARGYVVLYTNPRGSTSYGKEFANTIHLNYPSNDYDDLMSGVDVLLEKGFINEKELFVTGGSGGGVLTAWTVGHTDRFAAAVVAKPVINWYSFVLTADFYPFFYKYWFDKKPWEDLEGYMKRSPISYVGNVTTPTMLLTGESDHRTPISETEQFYQALKLNKVETAMVRIPNASHSIYRRPSNLMSKVEHILWWFDQYREEALKKKAEAETQEAK
ncbi:S9 family peptidase [Alteromonas sp. a30]|uniref:S9 family peptidase n=1 Tax=Alteromonas sp. a30 TaxID=2730917 RepID=UPI002280D722|nr:S9 family peptidase [Alteromonas sp. a30]